MHTKLVRLPNFLAKKLSEQEGEWKKQWKISKENRFSCRKFSNNNLSNVCVWVHTHLLVQFQNWIGCQTKLLTINQKFILMNLYFCDIALPRRDFSHAFASFAITIASVCNCTKSKTKSYDVYCQLFNVLLWTCCSFCSSFLNLISTHN